MNAVIITGRYCTDCEYTYALYRLQEEGIRTHVATLHKQEMTGILGEKIIPTHAVEELNATDYELVILPGGAKAMEYLRQSQELLSFLRTAGAITVPYAPAVIGAICHGTQLLISAGLCKDRRISGYYSIKDDIINAGGIWVDEPAVVDHGIVTSPHYKYLGHWMKAVLAELGRVNTL